MTYKLPKFTREEVLEMDHKYNVHSWSAQKALKNIIPLKNLKASTSMITTANAMLTCAPSSLT